MQTSYIYDPVTDANSLVEHYTYDSNGYLASQTDARGAVTTYNYDSNGLLQYRIDPCNAIGLDLAKKQIKVAYQYDGARRITSEEEFSCEVGQISGERLRKTTYSYDNDPCSPTWGRLLSQTVRYDWNGSSYGHWQTTRYRYDALGRQIRVIRPDGVVSGVRYNTAGRRESEFVLADGSDPCAVDGDLTLLSQRWYEYDRDGRLKSEYKAKADGPFSFADPCDLFPEPTGVNFAWIRTDYEYDFLGRKTAMIEDVGTGANNLELKTSYEYNNQGELIKTTHPNGKWVKSERDGRGLLIKQTTGHGTSTEYLITEYKYDSDGNLLEKLEPYVDKDGNVKKVKTIYTYDNLGRLQRTLRGIVVDN